MTRTTYKLYGCKGCGSTPIEAALELHDIAFEFIEVEPWESSAACEELQRYNPLVQVPTLVTADGSVLTESAGILLWLLNQNPFSPLLPRDAAARAALYRWTVFIAANIYAAVGIGDFPERWVDGEEAQKSLKEKTTQRSMTYWKMLEENLNPSPYLLGETMSALDLYAATVSRWRPGRQAVAEACPKLAAAFALTEQNPIVARVWARNFGS